MATRAITVFVADQHGYGKYGYQVWAYNGERKYTGKDGKALVFIDGERASIYVNGITVYDGTTSRCPNPLQITR